MWTGSPSTFSTLCREPGWKTSLCCRPWRPCESLPCTVLFSPPSLSSSAAGGKSRCGTFSPGFPGGCQRYDRGQLPHHPGTGYRDGSRHDRDDAGNFMTSRHFPLWRKSSRILVTCPKGIASYLKGEMESLGFPVELEREAAIVTSGTLGDTLRLNLLCVRDTAFFIFWVKARSTTPRIFIAGLQACPGKHSARRRIPLHHLHRGSPLHQGYAFCQPEMQGCHCRPSPENLRPATGFRPGTGSGGGSICSGKAREPSFIWIPPGNPLSRRGYRLIPSRPPCRKPLRRPLFSQRAGLGKAPLSTLCAAVERSLSKPP